MGHPVLIENSKFQLYKIYIKIFHSPLPSFPIFDSEYSTHP